MLSFISCLGHGILLWQCKSKLAPLLWAWGEAEIYRERHDRGKLLPTWCPRQCQWQDIHPWEAWNLHPVRSHLLQLLALPHSPFNYEYTSELIHWSGQHSQDPITFPKLHLWQWCWELCLQHRNFWITVCIKSPNSFLSNDDQRTIWSRHMSKWYWSPRESDHAPGLQECDRRGLILLWLLPGIHSIHWEHISRGPTLCGARTLPFPRLPSSCLHGVLPYTWNLWIWGKY